MAPVPGKVIPVCVACILYRRFGWYFLVIMLAEWAKDAIDILFHQILDFENDRECGIRTYPVMSGPAAAARSLRRLVTAGTVGALAMGATLAWLVEEYRWVFGAALLLAVPAALTYRRFWHGRSAGTPEPGLPFAYLWFGGIILLQSPMWLSGVAPWRSRSFLPLALAVAVITVSQTIFYLRHRYR
jgi:hypothetical protein